MGQVLDLLGGSKAKTATPEEQLVTAKGQLAELDRLNTNPRTPAYIGLSRQVMMLEAQIETNKRKRPQPSQTGVRG
jgi:hypothetical protein